MPVKSRCMGVMLIVQHESPQSGFKDHTKIQEKAAVNITSVVSELGLFELKDYLPVYND